jgi:hypothetical protein
MTNHGNVGQVGQQLHCWIGSHKLGIHVKCLPSISFKKKQISGHMARQKQDKKKTGQRHNQFSSEGAIQGFGNPTHK